VLPLPRLRVRQVVTSCNVWDGQTVVLGGMISEDIRKIKDKVPILGDLPWVGRLFTSESNESNKKNLLVFVTPTIIDPAGNRLHTDEELPFARNSIPPQAAPANQ
jgi:general secretion pathway protein D